MQWQSLDRSAAHELGSWGARCMFSMQCLFILLSFIIPALKHLHRMCFFCTQPNLHLLLIIVCAYHCLMSTMPVAISGVGELGCAGCPAVLLSPSNRHLVQNEFAGHGQWRLWVQPGIPLLQHSRQVSNHTRERPAQSIVGPNAVPNYSTTAQTTLAPC